MCDQVGMYYGLETADKSAGGHPGDAAGAGQMLHVQSPDGSTFLPEITTFLPS